MACQRARYLTTQQSEGAVSEFAVYNMIIKKTEKKHRAASHSITTISGSRATEHIVCTVGHIRSIIHC